MRERHIFGVRFDNIAMNEPETSNGAGSHIKNTTCGEVEVRKRMMGAFGFAFPVCIAADFDPILNLCESLTTSSRETIFSFWSQPSN